MGSAYTNLLYKALFILLLLPQADLIGQCEMEATIIADPEYPWVLCPGEFVTLTAVATGGTAPYSYLWSDGATTQSTIVTAPFMGNMFVTITDATGCAAFGFIHVKIFAWDIEIVFNPAPICDGEEFGLYSWPDFPPGTMFIWSTGETTEDIFVVTSGTFSVTATSPDGECTGSTTATVDIAILPSPSTNINGPEFLCSGTAILTADGDPNDFYTWSTGENGQTATATEPGVYWVVVENSFGCADFDSIIILSGANTPLLSGPTNLCTGETGTIEVINETDFVEFDWNTGESTFTITINGPGTYTVTATDSGGCSATASITVDPGSSTFDITGTVIPVTSCMQPNGEVDISISPSGTYTFEWSNGSNLEDVNNLTSGSYIVTVSDLGGCTSSAEFIVDDMTISPGISVSSTSSTCDLDNGAIDLTIDPPASYLFAWSNGETTEDLTNIMAGSYSITVTSTVSGCSSFMTIVVGNNNPPITISGNTTPLTSCTMPNGAIDITITPGGTYTYLWSNGATTEDISNLSSGNYIITVSAGGSCTESSSYTVINNTISPVLTLSPTSATCGQSNGAVDLSVLPAGSYTYLWSTGATTEDLTILPSGIYSVTVTDILTSCTATADITLPDDQIMITITGTTIPNTLCLGSNGAIDININPSGTYTFLWSNGETTEDITALPAESYTVTATLGLTCTQTASFEVSEIIDPILITGNITPNSSCTQPNGAIDISVDPSAAYSYVWSNGEVTEDISQLTGGTYGITVTDNDGCSASAAFVIMNTSSNYTFEAIVSPNTSCSSADGNIDLILFPPGSYTYAWTNGFSTEDIHQLVAGIYGVTITDVNDCSSIASYNVTDSLLIPEITGQASPESCGNNDGSIDITVDPGSGNVFLWSTGSTNEDINNLAAGVYSITVTASNGCTAIGSFSVLNQNSTFFTSGAVIPNSSCTAPNGAIDLSVSPPGAYTFAWSNAAVDEDISGLSSGSYSVTVTDISNCTSLDTFLVNDITSTPTLQANISPAICGSNNGAIDLITNPAINTIYLWSNGAITEDLQNLLPGDYSVITTDTLSGCTALDSFNVPNINNNFSSSAILTPNTACISQNGIIDLTVMPAGAYTFSWSTGATTEDLFNLSSGTYTVTISDISSCSSTETFVIIENKPVITIASVITPSSCGLSNGAIQLFINPSTGNTFIWSNGETTEDLQNLSSGMYFVTVTGTGGCDAVDTFIIYDQGLAITLQGITTPNTTCTSTNGSIDLSVNPNGAYFYQWSTGNTTQDVGNLGPGVYTVTVSDINDCSASSSFTIDEQSITPVILSTIIPSNCGNNNGQIDLAILPAGTYLFTWSNGATSEDLTALFPGMYAVTITGQGGCASDTILEVTNAGLTFSLSATISDNTDCINSNGSIALTISPAGNYTYLWSNGETTEDLQNISSGTYTVSVSDQSGCSTAIQYIVDNNVTPLLVDDVITPVFCGESNGAIDLMVTPETGNTFLWSNGSVTEDLFDIPPGYYEVTITGQNGCLWTSAFQVDGSTPIQINLVANAAQTGVSDVTIIVTLNVPIETIDTLIWLPEELFNCDNAWCLEQTIPRPDSRTEIKVIAVDTNGCIAQTALFLESIAAPEVYIPNVFSPNADGINDLFTVYGNKDVEIVEELQIFDRWGNQVFVAFEFPPNEENYGWDGDFRNKPMNPAVFVYWARVRYTDGNTGRFKGDVTLVR